MSKFVPVFFTSDSQVLHTYYDAIYSEFVDRSEVSGQWWMPVPNQVDGAPPPPGSPNRVVNVGNGADFLLGTYNATAESFTPFAGPTANAILEHGSASWFGASGGSDNNGRMMLIGWATPDFVDSKNPGIPYLTRLTLLREVNWDSSYGGLVSNPVPELTTLRNGTIASERSLSLTAAPIMVRDCYLNIGRSSYPLSFLFISPDRAGPWYERRCGSLC